MRGKWLGAMRKRGELPLAENANSVADMEGAVRQWAVKLPPRPHPFLVHCAGHVTRLLQLVRRYGLAPKFESIDFWRHSCLALFCF